MKKEKIEVIDEMELKMMAYENW